MTTIRPTTKILVDGGDPEETAHIRNLLGFLDGQTTNPTLVAKNPGVRKRIASGHKLTRHDQKEEYRKIVQAISPLVDSAGVSIEVFADVNTTAKEMLTEGEEMFTWIPNAYIKYPCILEGFKAAKLSVERGMRVNMTLCFSQAQAAAVYAATLGSKDPVYVSPFVGRLDDRGENGMDLIANIKRMYAQGDGHVQILAASLRSLDHLMGAFFLGSELATAPAKVLEEWAAGKPLPDEHFRFKATDGEGKALKPIPYEETDLHAPWESFNLKHELTDQGIRRFVEDYKNTLESAA